MTNYSISLSSIIEIGVSKLDLNNVNANRYLLGHHGQPQSDRALYQGLSNSYNEMCQLLKIYEFLIIIYPDEFLDVNKLNYINFINVIKNLSTRVINKPYIEHISNLISFINQSINSKLISEKNKIDLLQIGLSIAGIFIQINNSKSKNFDEFCKHTANVPDLDIEPFLEFKDILIKELENSTAGKVVRISKSNDDLAYRDDIIKRINTEYVQIVTNLIKIRSVKVLTNDEMDNLISQDKLCILCYEFPSDTELQPCKHRCCQNCYNQYKVDKNTCFICQQQIESVIIDNPTSK